MIFRSVAVVALIAALGACSTAPPKTMTFGPQSATALMVAANPELMQEIRIEMRRVDMESKTFADQQIAIQNSDQINLPALAGWTVDPSMPARLSLHEVEPGYYAIVYLTASHSVVNRHFTSSRCMASGAPVFFVPQGQVSIIQMGEYWNNGRVGSQPTSMADDRTLKAFVDARVEYPGIQGEPVLVTPSGVIRWTQAGDEPDACVDAPGFESFTLSEWARLVD